MVDLVKIRKKSKQQKADQEAGKEASQTAASEHPVDESRSASLPDHPSPQASRVAEPKASEGGGRERTSEESSPAADDERAVERLDRFRAEVGRKRDAMQAGSALSEADSSEVELLTFTIAGEQYAVDIDHIVEIVTPRATTRVPNSDAAVVGIMSLRGTIVTVVDIRRRLAHPPALPGPDSRIVVIERRAETLGFMVDRVLRVVKMRKEELAAHPVVHASELSDYILGVFQQAGSLTILLELERLLTE